MTEVGSVYVSVMAEARGFWRDAQRQIGPGATASGQQAGMQWGRQFSAQAGQGAADVSLSGAAQGADTAGSQAGSRFGQALQTAAGVFVGMVAVNVTQKLGNLFSSAISGGFNRLVAIDDAKAKLSGLGNSAESVTAIMQNALAAVKGTAFGMDEAATTAAGAVAAGIKPGKELEATLKLVGDAATIGGTSMAQMGSIFNKVATSNKIQGDVIAQLSDAGIPVVQLLSKELGKSAEETVKLASAGKINFATFQKAMQAGLGGAALKSGETFSGAMKNAKAAMNRVGANLLAGIFPQLKTELGRFTAAMEPLEAQAKVFGKYLGDGLAFALRSLHGLVDNLPKMGAQIRDLFSSFQSGAGGQGGMSAIAGATSALGVAFQRLWEAAKGIDFRAIMQGFAGVGTLVLQLTHLMPVFNALVDMASGALRFLADHMDTIIKILPVIIAGYAAWKVALMANTVFGRQSAYGLALSTINTWGDIFARRAYVAAINQQTAAMTRSMTVQIAMTDATGAQAAVTVTNTVTTGADAASTTANTGAQNLNVLARIRNRIATALQNSFIWAQTAATWAATAATTALSAAMAFLTSPIGIVVAAVAALIAIFVLLYKHNAGFRDAVNKAWSGIKDAFAQVGVLLQSVWAGVIKPVLDGFWQGVQAIGTVVGAIWTGVIQPVFGFIGTLIAAVWKGVIEPVFRAWQWYFVTVLGPALSWLWANVVSPVFSWIGGHISKQWNTVIKPALTALWSFVQKNLIPVIQNFWPIMRIVWDSVSAKISNVWNGSIRPVFSALKSGIEAVRSTFRTVVDAIGSIWDELRGKVERPVKFVVNGIVRDKLVAGWNAVAGKVGLPTWDFKGFARGGWTGPGGKYDPAGIVHADEFVVRKESRGSIEREAPGLLDALNRYGARALNRLAPSYADGGQVSKVQVFLQKLLSKQGARYVLGASHTPKEWANPSQSVFDCCIAYSVPILTTRGPVKMGEVQVGDQVYTWTPEGPVVSTVGRVMKQAVQQTYTVRTGRSKVTASANHPFLVLRRSAPTRSRNKIAWSTEWVRLDGLAVGDYIVHTDGLDRQTGPQTIGRDHAWMVAGQESRHPVNMDVAWLLGQILGDGHVNKTDVRVASFDPSDRERIAAIAAREFGATAHFDDSNGVILNGRRMAAAFEMLHGLHSYDKAVPSFVWDLPEEELRAFLAGYHAADGSTDKNDGSRIYCSTSEDLIVGVRALHQALGDNVSNVTVNRRTKPITIHGVQVKHARPIYRFSVSVGSKRGQKALFRGGSPLPDGFTVERVRSITEAEVEQTYDLTVEGTSNYVADGMVVHNSGFLNWGITQTGLKPIGYTAATIGRGNPQIGLGKAQSTPGAFLYRTSSPHAGTTGHIAASLGNGQTIEAMGSKYGVRKGSSVGRFEGGSMHPGLVGSLSAEEQAALAEAIASSDGWSMPNAAAEIVKALVSPFFSGAKSLITGMLGQFGSTDLIKLVAGTGTSMVSGVESFIDKMIDKVFPAFTLGGTGAGAQMGAGDVGESSGGDVRSIVQSVAAKYGWGSGPQWEALSWIIGKESGWNPTAQNPHSTAYGLFQFLNSTWAGLGFSKSSNPLVQAQAGMKYIHDRYASPLGAKAFWQSHGWYADGGRVLPLRPTLYDTGGILPPGISLVQNKTGKPETIRTHEQERDVQRQIASGATYNLQVNNVDSRDRIAQLMEALRQKEIRDRAKARVMARA